MLLPLDVAGAGSNNGNSCSYNSNSNISSKLTHIAQLLVGG